MFRINAAASTPLSALLILLTAACAAGKTMGTVGEPKDSYNICDSPVCLRIAKQIKDSLDPCVEPCDDFYSYACGEWMRSHKIPENQASFSAYNKRQNELDESMREILGNMSLVYGDNQNAMDKAAVAYNACLAVPGAGDQHEVLQQIMKDSGLSDWPLLPQEKQKRAMSLNWTEMLLNVGLSPVLQLMIVRDGVNLTSHIIQLDKIAFTIIGRDPLVDPDFRYHVPAILAYKKLIAATAKFINPDINEMQAKILANDLFHFEGMLANLTKLSEEQGYGSVFTTTIAEVQKHFPSFPLLDLLNKEFSTVNITLNETESLDINSMDYYARLTEFLNKAEAKTFFNYLGMRTVFRWAEHASKDVRNASLQVQKAMSGEQSEGPRWQTCVPLLLNGMEEAASYLYVTHKFNKEAKIKAGELVRKVKEAFNESLQSNTWMDPDTKHAAKIKLQEMGSKIGYPEWLLNTTALGEYSKYIPKLGPNSPFLSIWRSLLENNWKLMLDKLRVPYDPDKHWILSGPVVNALYDAVPNEVVFPAGVLHSIFYEPGLPQSINMGTFGSLAGHELTHGFDHEGSLHDAQGRPLWTNATREKFLEKSECFLQQYGRVRDKQTGMQLNGRSTLEENIADNGGLRSAYRAYKNTLKEEFNDTDTRLRGLEELSGEKLFFIANAMVGCSLYRTEFLRYQIFYGPHSPSKYRINIPRMNMVEFSAAFNCPAHSPMNPDRSETCSLW